MSTMAEIVGEPGLVQVAGRWFTLSPLSIREETRLYKRWEAIAREHDELRLKRTYAAIAKAPEDMRAEMLREVVREVKRGDPLSWYTIGVEARSSLPGVLEDLFARTRAAHPDVTRDDLAAILNEHNAQEVYDAIVQAVADMNPKDPAPSP